MMTMRLTDKDRARVLEAVAAGLSTPEIANLIGCSTVTIRTIRRRAGVSAKTGRAEVKPWRTFTCPRCGRIKKTKRDNQIVCGKSCMVLALHEARWKLPSDEHERRALLTRLYWDEGCTSPEIAKRLGMSHKGILDAMRALDIQRRSIGTRPVAHCIDDDCRLPVWRIQHRTNGSWYGRRCRLHWIIYRMKLEQEYNDKHLGKDDEAWLRRMRQLLARVKRLNREVSQSLKLGSAPATTSPAVCRR